MSLLIALAACNDLPEAPDLEPVLQIERVEDVKVAAYPVTARTAKDAHAKMKDLAQTLQLDGLTKNTWRLELEAERRYFRGACHLGRVELVSKLLTRRPDWTDHADASEPDRAWWNELKSRHDRSAETTLTAVRNASDQAEERLRTLGSREDCDTLKVETDTLMDEVRETLRVHFHENAQRRKAAASP